MPTQKLKKKPKEPKYNVGDMLRMDFGLIDQMTKEPVIYYVIINKIEGDSYYYNYLDDWEYEGDMIKYIDEHRGITLHA